MKLFFPILLSVLFLQTSNLAGELQPAAAPKRLLVVSVSTRNRFQASINAAEKELSRLSNENHAFTIDFVHQPSAPQPKKPKPPVAIAVDASVDAQAKFAIAQTDYAAALVAYAPAKIAFDDAMKKELLKLSPESLKQYDGVVFCYTSGDLPLPDVEGFFAWVKAGHAFIALGSANETLVSYPHYYDMLGGKWTHFKGVGSQEWTDLEIVTENPGDPANQGMPLKWNIKEFSYKIPNFKLWDAAHTHELLTLEKSPTRDETPGHFPLAWCRNYGQGRVFYTALGGNLDLWDADALNRKNSPEIARLFETHLRGGIDWALKISPLQRQ